MQAVMVLPGVRCVLVFVKICERIVFTIVIQGQKRDKCENRCNVCLCVLKFIITNI
jgi:hypothetical protein